MKWRSPKGEATLLMALASACHYAGYEFARNAVLALFTSERTGFKSSAAMPLAVGCISPISIALLWLYTRLLNRGGPRYAIRTTTLFCFATISVAGLMLNTVNTCVDESTVCRQLSRIVSFSMIVIQSSFVQLLSVQHWSFLGSILQTTDAKWAIAPIAGLGSITSTLAACAVSPLVDILGLPTLMITGSFVIAISAYCADAAYDLAETNGFEPKKETKLSKQDSSSLSTTSLLATARNLFARVPVLAALRNEVLISQCLSSLVSFLCVLKLKEAIPDDANRARRTGNSYAVISAVSGILQFLVLPFLANRLNPRIFWIIMPVCMLGLSLIATLSGEVSLDMVAITFCSMKIMEYSFRGVANEMVYASLDFESRYVGKEIIGLGCRFGKSGMAITLFLLASWYEDASLLVHHSMIALTVVSIIWLGVSFQLNNLIKASEKEKKSE
jgi:ATP/ADP translocase